MKRLITAALLVAAVGCDSKPTGDTAPPAKVEGTVPEGKMDIPAPSKIEKEAKEAAKDVINKKAPKWTVTYKGAMSGEIKGGILSVVGLPHLVTAMGAAMQPDMKGKATEQFMLTVMAMEGKDPHITKAELTTPDGTKCRLPSESTQKLDLKDRDRKTFDASISGELVCGDDKKKISYTATMKAKP